MICPACGAANDDGAEVCFTCRAVLAALTQGSVVGGRYEILSPLGRGGMGAVYRAHDRVLDETVALKVLRGEVAGEPEMARRFRSEIKLARRVAHPSVCRIYEYGEDGSRQYISMELVEGTNLKEVLRQRGALPPDEAYDYAVAVAEGLEAIHRVGIVHRDLKSLNVMIDTRGAAKVMDFGIAKRIAGEGVTAPSGSYVVGSPEYMSPEQARGQPVDFRSDIYALGIVVFEMFTGRVPFRGDTPVATLLMHLETPPPLDGPAASAIPAPVRAVLRKALAKDPAVRYPSAQEMADALRSAAASGADARLAPAPALSTRRRAGVGAAAAVAVIGAIGLWSWIHGEGPATSAVAPPPIPEPSVPAASPSPTSSPRAPLMPTPQDTPSASPRAVASAPPIRTPTPAPPSPSPTAAATPATAPPAAALPTAPPPTATPAPTPEPDGFLLVIARPWADVTVDERLAGQTPLRRIALRPGAHEVVLAHPDYRPFQRKVTIRPGQTFRLDFDFATEGVRRAR
jgi:serine/threonine-protein kinase